MFPKENLDGVFLPCLVPFYWVIALRYMISPCLGRDWKVSRKSSWGSMLSPGQGPPQCCSGVCFVYPWDATATALVSRDVAALLRGKLGRLPFSTTCL